MRSFAKLAFLALAAGMASLSVAHAQLPYDGRRDHRPPPRIFRRYHPPIYQHHYHRPPPIRHDGRR